MFLICERKGAQVRFGAPNVSPNLPSRPRSRTCVVEGSSRQDIYRRLGVLITTLESNVGTVTIKFVRSVSLLLFYIVEQLLQLYLLAHVPMHNYYDMKCIIAFT